MFIADVFDVLLIDDKGEVFATTTLTEANIEVSVQENEIRGGKGNELLGTLHTSRDITINLTDVEFKYDWLAKNLGQDIKTGAGVAYAMPKLYKVEDVASNLQIKLDKTPLSIDDLHIYDIKGNKLVDFTLDGDTVSFTNGVEAGDMVEVRTYTYSTPTTTQYIKIDNKVFAKGVKCILETIEIDGDEKPLYIIQYHFYKAVPTGSFTLNTASERNAQTHEFNLRVIKPKYSTEVGEVYRIPIEQ